ncbi:TetR/AcrR family transcriptional regulator [Lapidilactobacillus bayanensis]|uniref:TetR/AcrR family transcriptional regulator n=1 Tax=Lapidilactobacillus bayanensis TaxID=2485998 RepID=UPI000F76CE83|nr:TetR/AcrR family transcriptional regulator [Lapidilactobacillus bayanensis]
MTTHNFERLFEQSLATSNLSEKQRAVLSASLQLFADQGFDHTSTSDIAAAAGVSEGTVYKHFKTKDQILNAIITPFITEVVPQAAAEFIADAQANSNLAFATFIRYFLRDRLTFADQNRKEGKIFFREALAHPEMMARLSQQFEAVLAGPLTRLIHHYQVKSDLIDWPPTTILRYIIGTLGSYLIPSIVLNDQPLNIDEITATASEFLIKGLAPK